LIELLLVIAIVTVLSTMALGVLRSATTDAKISATNARFTQIESMFGIVLEDYEVRRMPVNLFSLASNRRDARNMRYQIIAELIDVEIPRPGMPLGEYPQGTVLRNYFGTNEGLTAGMKRWELVQGSNFDLPGEYLYQFFSSFYIDGSSGIELLGSQAVADSDDDKIFEIVDSWGEPLIFKLQQRVNDTGVDEVDFVDFNPAAQPETQDIRIVLNSTKFIELGLTTND
jgi:type II secretory pathway pseudopilin PulG